MRILDLVVTPVAFRDPPLLNASGVHEPLVLRCVLQLVVEGGVVGLGECPGERAHVERLVAAGERIRGMSVFATGAIERAVDEALGGPGGPLRKIDRVAAFSAIEVACLDAQGRLTGLPVSDLLGGAVRDAVPYSAYLFYKWAEHPALDGGAAVGDEWGAALDPAGVVDQARRMIDRYGFRSIKLKGGVFPPDQEIAAIRALREAFPDHPLRIDPNCAWTVETSRYVADELKGVLEYLEDPTAGVEGMAAVSATATMPLATNMCVVSFEEVRPAVERDAVQVVLSDHHYWGGLRRTRELAAVCETLGLGMSMHSNSHLGISLAAMTHVAAATPNLTYACDTHYPWNAADDVVAGGPLRFVDGAVPVPRGPGLGVELDHAVLDRLHGAYIASGRERRDDTGYMRRIEPGYDPALPRW
ncbi:glucarate dehydratase [Streptosporangium becharense]|uniref:glucarate dehydratase n=1 Tax=Streptosporangium becharense TaxID=1816182 RepID=A0A7W9IK65_9ACTN|nr:glucarate dehydratase family protein [Streptosporangium becharense]MBB2911339.1 glucarate dehydratase [Streptosporangium becharense]MBB5821603.1 glucarate dehydratase [Streptosporangium becharense]